MKVSLKKTFLLLNCALIGLYFLLNNWNQKDSRLNKTKPNSNPFSRPTERLLLANCSHALPPDSALIGCGPALTLLEEPLIGPFNCSSVSLLVVVFNRVNDFERRQTIRETWKRPLEASTALNARVLFAIAKSGDAHVQSLVEEESREQGDLLQFAFLEAYFNCTLKAVGVVRFAALFCPAVEFVLKVDDDAFVSAHALESALSAKDLKAFHGFVWRAPKVQRDNASKWRISEPVIRSSSSYIMS